MRKIIKWSEFLADSKTRKSMIYRPGLECVYDSGALPLALATCPEGSILHLQHELSAYEVPGTINDWLIDPKALSEAQVQLMIQEALAEWGGEDPRMKPLLAENLAVGDMLFFDRQTDQYCIVKRAAIGAVLADYDQRRYETNYDTFVGTSDNMAHFVALDDAYSQTGMYQDDTAATPCYYRIEFSVLEGEVDAGHVKFDIDTGDDTITGVAIEWDSQESPTEILNRFKEHEGTYAKFSLLDDETGIAVSLGGRGTNKLTVIDIDNCKVFDCSAFAFLRSQNPAAPEVGGTFNPRAAWTYLHANTHHSFRGSAAKTILGDHYESLVGENTTCVANSGFNYGSRCGLNFAKFKSWATESGDYITKTDGVNGSANGGSVVMRQWVFSSAVIPTGTSDGAKMYEYYHALFSNQSGEFATLREEYESKYGKMTDLYDAYLMSHMVDPSANTGIVATMRNAGDRQTNAKADLMNVDANYKIIPAYPPEYNAKHYGLAGSEGFIPGTYYHPEPTDLSLMFRDDIMPAINDNIYEVRAALLENVGTLLTNALFRGSCADVAAVHSWFYNGDYGVFNRVFRNYGYFRSRPSLALPLPY